MRHVVLLMLGLVFSGFAIAQKHSEPDDYKIVMHTSILTGLKSGEGRIIRSDVYVNNKFQDGYYFCAGSDAAMLHQMTYGGRPVQVPFRANHLVKFSICQDDTLAECQPFATDKFTAFSNAAGDMAFDTEKTSVDVSSIKNAFQNCEPPKMDDLVNKSIHMNDRRFAHVG